jgi:hypothetical protein
MVSINYFLPSDVSTFDDVRLAATGGAWTTGRGAARESGIGLSGPFNQIWMLSIGVPRETGNKWILV